MSFLASLRGHPNNYPDKHGFHGCGCAPGSSPPRLSRDELLALKCGQRVVVTWDGGNGPHLYEIVEESMHPIDMDKLWQKDRVCRVKMSDLIESPCNYVSLPTVSPVSIVADKVLKVLMTDAVEGPPV